jgi:hypothetical protein
VENIISHNNWSVFFCIPCDNWPLLYSWLLLLPNHGFADSNYGVLARAGHEGETAGAEERRSLRAAEVSANKLKERAAMAPNKANDTISSEQEASECAVAAEKEANQLKSELASETLDEKRRWPYLPCSLSNPPLPVVMTILIKTHFRAER